MFKGKWDEKSAKHRSVMLLLASLLILGTVAAGVTLAYVFTRTEPITNVFAPAKVSCRVLETFENNVKSHVKIQNTGTADAYIRVAIVATWVADKGTDVYAAKPIEGSGQDYTLVFADDFAQNWLRDANGFYYHKSAVPVQGTTAQLIKSCTVNGEKTPAGFHLSVEIVASAIQAFPETAAEEQWHVIVEGGKIRAVPRNQGKGASA